MFALGYLNWSGTGATTTSGWYSNAVHGGTAGTVGDVNPVIMDNARQWQFLTDWSLPYSLRFVGEYIMNKKVVYGTRANPTNKQANRSAYALSLVYGKAKKAQEWSLAYTYGNKGIASVVGTFTNGDVKPDNISHLVEAKYMLEDMLNLGLKVQFHKEKAMVGGDGVALTSPNDTRKQTEKRFEFYTSVGF